ncbi:MAG TPA: esterase, partial [Myxococcales bacterium]|nr:esterase [Myxococcales bacterium]
KKSRFDDTDPPLAIIHGTEDKTVPYERATELIDLYSASGAPYELFKLQGAGHSAWNAKLGGKSLSRLSFEFAVKYQGLKLEP